MTSWQPIETAPRDGTLFIACQFHSDGEPYWIGVQRWHDPYGDGELEVETVTIEGGPSEYTHWLPLPDSPLV